MYSTYSATSTRRVKRTPRPFPWQLTFAMLLALAAGILLARGMPPAARSYRAAQHEAHLTWAGVVAEAVEQQLADGADDLPTLAALITPCLAQEPSFAYVRLWSPAGALRCEVTRLAPSQPRAGTRGVLPEMGVRRCQQALMARITRRAWVDPIMHLQILTAAQGDLTATLEDADKQSEETINACYARQYDILKMAEALEETHALQPAVREMNRVLDVLERKDEDACARAADASDNAETAASLALEEYRAQTDILPNLPAPLRNAASSGAWWRRLLGVRGQRVLIPLFTPMAGNGLTAPAGFAEIVFYDRPVELAAAVARRNLPAAILLLAALILACARRRTPRVARDG